MPDRNYEDYAPALKRGATLEANDIADDSVTTAKILDSNVTLAKLASGITPSHIVSAATRHTFDASATTDAATLTGVSATDVIVATVNVQGSGAEKLISAEYSTTNTVLITLDTAGESGTTIVSVTAFKAAA